MGWMLIVSSDDNFQREAIVRAGNARAIVGATGEASAYGLVRAVDVETILVDALDDVGRRFLGVLRSIPRTAFPGVKVIPVGPQGSIPSFEAKASIDQAFQSAEPGSTVAA
jgi:hypothetical protein